MNPICKYCGIPMQHSFTDDGGGDYGDSVVDVYACPECDWQEEEAWEDYDEDEFLEGFELAENDAFDHPVMTGNIPDAGSWLIEQPDEPPTSYNPPPRDMDDIPF